MRYRAALFLSALLLAAASARAQDMSELAQSATPPERTSILYTFGDDPCPAPVGEDIIVCAQRPETERYRVPRELREAARADAPTGGGSWASRVEGYDKVARQSRPDSCSPVGTYGFTGCAALALREWFEARRAD